MLGFTEIAELDAVMQKLIAESGHYLFYTLCGGTGGDSRTESVAEIWAATHALNWVSVIREEITFSQHVKQYKTRKGGRWGWQRWGGTY